MAITSKIYIPPIYDLMTENDLKRRETPHKTPPQGDHTLRKQPVDHLFFQNRLNGGPLEVCALLSIQFPHGSLYAETPSIEPVPYWTAIGK